MIGLTLPGMMLEPGAMGGRLISCSPARGPEDSRRRSLQILESLTATRLSTPESWTYAPGVLGGFDQVLRFDHRDAADLASLVVTSAA
jgi:hypothetical protein